MIEKSCGLPFSYSQIALLVVSLSLMPGSARSETNEGPAVLQFARKYQTQQTDVPRQEPVSPSNQAKPRLQTAFPHDTEAQKSTRTATDWQALSQLQHSIAQQEREIASRNLTIRDLEKKLSQLQQSAKTPIPESATLSPQDVQLVNKMATSLRQSFSLTPDMAALKEQLKQANIQASNAKMAEARVRDQQKLLTVQIDNLKNQLGALQKKATRTSTENQAAINAQLKELSAANQRLEADLAASKKTVSRSSEQIAKLDAALKSLESEKQQLNQQLAGAPTPTQLENTQAAVKTLQAQLDTAHRERQTSEAALATDKKAADARLAALQQQLDTAHRERQTSEAALAADKKAADARLAALQQQLDAARTQQTALLAEKQRLEQTLKSDLTDKEKSGAAVLAQLKSLRDELATAQQQQQALSQEKETLRQQLSRAPSQQQLSESMLKVQALQSQLDTAMLQQKKEQSVLADAHVRSAKLEELSAANQRLEADLAASKKAVSRSSEQIAKLDAALKSLESEKQQLNQQLAGAPTPTQLESTQAAVKALQAQLDTAHREHQTSEAALATDKKAADARLAALQQQLDTAHRERQTSEAALAADKKAADARLATLQQQLDAAHTQQTALLAEKQRLEQTLKSDLTDKEKSGAAVLAQLKSLRDELATAQQQQQALSQEKETLRQQLSRAPSQQQLSESMLKVQALQSQLDTAMLQQKKEQSALADVESRSAALAAEKQTLKAEVLALQQSKSQIEAEKLTLQQRLDAAPTSEQLAEHEIKTKLLQNELDNLTLLSKKEGPAHKSADKIGGVVQEMEKQVAEDKLKVLQDKLDAAQAKLAELEKQQSSPGIKGMSELTAESLKKKSTREAYAIGVSLGEEILLMQAENRDWASTESDRPGVLAGIIDSFQGKPKLSPKDLQKSIMNVSERVRVGREKLMSELDKSTKKFVTNFTKNKNTKKSDLGYWYRIGYAGDTPVPQGATIDVVVKESLTNGVVVEDMDAKGITLTQPISAFPPVFREALSNIKNHGSITLVVPPALAYGDKGFPPKIPPNATMVYDLRISDIYPEPQKSNGAQ